MRDIYHTISTHHETLCGPTQKRGAPQPQTVYVTKTISSTLTDNTITPTRTTTQYVTLTETATADDTAPTAQPRSNCYWLAVHELDKANDLYNLTSELEIRALSGLVSQAREYHQTLEHIMTEQNLERAERAKALDDVLYYLVDEPLGHGCDVFLNLTKHLIGHGPLTPQEKREEDIGALFDVALRKLESAARESLWMLGLSTLSSSAADVLSLVLRMYTVDAQSCFDTDCGPGHIKNMWLTAEGLRDVLKERLELARVKVLADDNKGESVSAILWTMGLALGGYGVVRILVQLTA
ncbi:hypothetical protein F5B22DRAFT_175532 [Xylaria bambusicola]|uniref:uncharacterized protein n=1 Tax=Xylaria bambusicola TaxID=326684 RepID=UPI00200838AF|nr:uncharacterized protein F5B22DRAFT_175532 [Xylaria bambusicola]KAI0526725.1 hypothetical protein F5B22DRAFT_175532 [Xylaria bambusicola]